MSGRDLVGRPLVPFFDAEDNVNDALTTDATMGFESMDVDARVWNKELGYFEYPSEQQSTKSASSQQRSAVASAPIAIQSSKKTQHKSHNTQSDGNGSYGSASRMLLTPAMMLSSSCPDATSLSNDRDPVQQQPTDSSANTRSSSAKRASKQGKSRSNTPVRRRNNSKPGTEGGSGGEQPHSGNDSKTSSTKHASGGATGSSANASGKKGKNKSKENGGGGQQKGKEDLSSSGKWAWSAFQSSPDPKQLPLPPFLTAPATSGGLGPPQAPPLPPQAYEHGPPLGQLDFSSSGNPEQPPQPTIPPETTQQPMSIELSMTQDLRRMLNIGGG